MIRSPEEHDPLAADPQWFRPPTRREHLIAAGLFVGFGCFFTLLFVVNHGWWFRWVVLVLATVSGWHALRHLMAAGKSGAGGT